MNNIKSIRVLLTLIENLLIAKKHLNDDLANNYEIAKQVCRNALYRTGVNVNIKGISNIPEDGPLLLISNHISFFDIILLVSIIDRPMPFAAAKELMSYPILKDYIEALKCALIYRDTNDINIMKEELKRIKSAIESSGLIVFPEGECSFNQEIYDFKKGAFIRLDNTRIVPTYINMPSIKKMGKWTIPTSDVDVIFGESFTVTNLFGKRPKAELVATHSKEKILELKHSLTIK